MVIDTDEKLLLDLLNTTPVHEGQPSDLLADPADGLRWLSAHGQPASEEEWRAALDARSALQDVVRGDAPPAALARFVEGVSFLASLGGEGDEGIEWTPRLPVGRVAAARAVLTWDALRVSGPGRLRACANDECRLFLIDHSRPNNARWCSMAGCGNRMKARRHYQRTRQGKTDG
ncbi:CGNR zinc finger domain-containing protein [Nonomuraea sp. NPDC048882]|uniref:CGNR zinc finger domain-containing protein n=1 Tax=unclassified Nonomuraea TaxID=2593643 RepID=UPI000A68A86A